MAEYKESTVSGTSYQRGRSIYFENPRNKTPSILVREETVNILQDKIITEPAGEILKSVDDLSEVFNLRNPLTNEIIEGQTATYQDIYVMLYSLYWHLAEERDIKSSISVPDSEVPPIPDPELPE